MFDAISDGAVLGAKMVGKIIANLIAFVSMFKLFDSLLIWIHSMIGLKNFGFGVGLLKIDRYLLYK